LIIKHTASDKIIWREQMAKPYSVDLRRRVLEYTEEAADKIKLLD
jgi:hypothetical protein